MIPFSREAFLDVFQRYNEDVWPLQFVLLGVALAALFAARRGTSTSSRVAAACLAALWLWMGVVYHWLYFTPINRAAWAFGALFVVQALLFGQAAARGTLRFGIRRGAWVGGALIGYALVVYPLLAQLSDHAFPRSPSFGLPCPTTIFTLGALLLTTGRPPRRYLVIPDLWALVGSTAWLSLGIREDLGLGIAALVAVIVAARRPSGAATR